MMMVMNLLPARQTKQQTNSNKDYTNLSNKLTLGNTMLGIGVAFEFVNLCKNAMFLGAANGD